MSNLPFSTSHQQHGHDGAGPSGYHAEAGPSGYHADETQDTVFEDSDESCPSESEDEEDSYDGGSNSDSGSDRNSDDEPGAIDQDWPLLHTPAVVQRNRAATTNQFGDWEEEEDQMDMWSEASASIRIGMLFKTKKELKHALIIWSVRQNREFHVHLSDKIRYRLVCQTVHKPDHSQRSESCKWIVRASVKKKHAPFWQITRWVNAHNCYGSVVRNRNRNVSSDFIAHQVRHLVERDVAVQIKILQAHITEKFNVEVSYHKAWHGRRKSIEGVYGTWESNFQELPTYIEALVAANPGTVVQWLHADSSSSAGHKFRYVFWAFGPVIEAFQNCIPVICVDGTHLRGSYMGKLLLAVTKDANNHVLTLAYAIVDNESIESWCWFMQQLRYFVANTSSRKLCVISDRHMGICRAMETLEEWKEPSAYHRFCLRHIRSNLMSHYNNRNLKKHCWGMGSTTQSRKFRYHLAEMKKISQPAWDYLDGIGKSKWSLKYDAHNRRWGNMTTNIAECMNNALRVARLLPIKACIEHTFHKTVQHFVKRREIAFKCDTDLPPRMWKLFSIRDTHAQEHTVTEYDRQEGVYRVVSRLTTNDSGGNDYTIDFLKRTCTCGKWQVRRFPCSHSLAVSRYRGEDVADTVSRYYTSYTYKKQYLGKFRPLRHKSYWDDPGWAIHADVSKISTKRGRRRARRFLNEMDVTQPDERPPRKCSICRQPGHNRSNCPT